MLTCHSTDSWQLWHDLPTVLDFLVFQSPSFYLYYLITKVVDIQLRYLWLSSADAYNNLMPFRKPSRSCWWAASIFCAAQLYIINWRTTSRWSKASHHLGNCQEPKHRPQCYQQLSAYLQCHIHFKESFFENFSTSCSFHRIFFWKFKPFPLKEFSVYFKAHSFRSAT